MEFKRPKIWDPGISPKWGYSAGDITRTLLYTFMGYVMGYRENQHIYMYIYIYDPWVNLKIGGYAVYFFRVKHIDD